MKTISSKPFQAQRFIVVQHFQTEEFKWVFCNGIKDHAQMEEEYTNEHTKAWSAVGGGFYTTISNERDDNNYETEIKYYRSILNPDTIEFTPKTLYLFDISGTFGLADWVLEEAFPLLSKQLDNHFNIKTNYPCKK